MKLVKKILGTVIFLGIGLVLFAAVSYLLRPITRDFYRGEVTGFYAEEEESLDIVAVGSSALYRYLNTPCLWREFGITSYNISTPSQSNFLIEDLIDEVEKTQSPQLIIIETRKFILAQSKSQDSFRFELVYNNMKYSWNRVELINSLIDTWSERINAYFDIITYHDSWEELSYENLSYIDNENDHKLKGWRNIAAVKKLKEPKIDISGESMPILEASEEALIQLMDKCKEENIAVLFVATPWKIDAENQLKNKYVGELIEANGFQFLDCNLYLEEIGLDFSKDFYNKNHTNMIGAEKVTEFIGNYVLENYDINTDHSEEVTADWNNMLETYNVVAEEVRAKIEKKAASAQ